MKRILILLATLCLFCFCLAGCASAADNNSAEQKKYVVYCSLNDEQTGAQKLTVAQAQELARNVITGRGLGYTEYAAYGGFVDGDHINGNDTLVYTFFFIEKSDADAVAAELKETLNLASVLMEELQSNYDFVE